MGTFPSIITDLVMLIPALPIIQNLSITGQIKTAFKVIFAIDSMFVYSSCYLFTLLILRGGRRGGGGRGSLGLHRFHAFGNTSAFFDVTCSAVELIIWRVPVRAACLISPCVLVDRQHVVKVYIISSNAWRA